MITAIVLSGGTGSRMGSDIPKQYMDIDGKPIIYYSMKKLFENNRIGRVLIVASQEWYECINETLGIIDSSEKFAGYVLPGETRQGSIINALEYICEEKIETEYVLVHDAARPFLSDVMIDKMIKSVEDAEGVLPTLPMKDTVYITEDGKTVSSLIDRKTVVAGQAPELFEYRKYYEANKQLKDISKINGSTEPAILAGMKIALIDGDENNFKITTYNDFIRAKEIIEGRKDN